MKVDLKRLKAERVASGLSQEDVAHRMGWKTRSPYAKRENGIIPISADELAEFVEIFGLPIDKLPIFFERRTSSLYSIGVKCSSLSFTYAQPAA